MTLKIVIKSTYKSSTVNFPTGPNLPTYVSDSHPVFLKDVSFHVSFNVKFGYMGSCDFSITNPQNTCLVM